MAKIPEYSSLDSSEQLKSPPGHIRRRPWQPGFFRRLPWLGVLSIVLAMGCAAAAVAIALDSDQQPLDRWRMGGVDVQPAVLLSIVATIGNALLVYAFTQGATVHWWTTALDPKGTTLSQLHSSYHFGSGITAIFGNVHALNAVALAGLFMPILLMDTPFFQRSVSIVQTTEIGRTNATVPISSSPLIEGSTGILPDHNIVPSLYHPQFAKVLQQYTNREPILLPNGTCVGTCELEVIASGWDIECTESTEPYRLATYWEAQKAYSSSYANGTQMKNSTYEGPKLLQTVFDIDVVYNNTLPDFKFPNKYAYAVSYNIELNVRRKATPGGNGTTALHNCKLIEALVKYPLIMQNSTVNLAPMPLSKNRTVEKIYRMPEMEMMGNMPSTLGGFWLALHSNFQTNSKYIPVGAWYSFRNSNPISSQYLRADNASDLDSTNIYFDDPMADMVLMANELAFRTAYASSLSVPGNVAGPALYNLTSTQSYILSPNLTDVNRTVHQHALVHSSTPITVYSTHRGWLAGAAVLMFIAAVLIACTYHGFWRLGRPVSMSPLEIARAFDAPIMQNTDPNATGQDLKKELGSERIYPRLYADSKSRERLASSESLTP